MLPYKQDDIDLLKVKLEDIRRNLEANSPQNRKRAQFMKHPPLVYDEKPREFLFSPNVDIVKQEKSLRKIKTELSKQLKLQLKMYKPSKPKIKKLTKKEIQALEEAIYHRGEIYKLPILQAIANEVAEILEIHDPPVQRPDLYVRSS
jgi:hypothetical protein